MDVTSRSVPAHSLSLSLFHNDPASLAASLPLGVGTSDHPPTRLNPLSEASEASDAMPSDDMASDVAYSDVPNRL